MIHVEIEEIDDGFVVILFDTVAPENYYKHVQVDCADAVKKMLFDWLEEIFKFREEVSE